MFISQLVFTFREERFLFKRRHNDRHGLPTTGGGGVERVNSAEF